jgi:hypothetical protein
VLDASRERLDAPADKDVVVMPCWRRPEFLWHCLDNLTRAEGIEDVTVLFRVDTGYSPEVLEVIQSFRDRMSSWSVEIADPCPYRRTKPSANFLLGLLHASQLTRRLVYLVEEDIMVSRDFFRWHNAVRAESGSIFCSIPVRNPNRKLALPDTVDGYYLSTGDSCSNGACYDKRVLQELIAPHVNISYFRRPKRYLRRCFPNSAVGLGFVEQDGLIRRIQETLPLPIAWPCVPRAFHAGYYGARGGWQHFKETAGSRPLQARIEAVSKTIYDADAVRAVIDHSDFLESCLPSSLELPIWRSLHRIDVPFPAGR